MGKQRSHGVGEGLLGPQVAAGRAWPLSTVLPIPFDSTRTDPKDLRAWLLLSPGEATPHGHHGPREPLSEHTH